MLVPLHGPTFHVRPSHASAVTVAPVPSALQSWVAAVISVHVTPTGSLLPRMMTVRNEPVSVARNRFQSTHCCDVLVMVPIGKLCT